MSAAGASVSKGRQREKARACQRDCHTECARGRKKPVRKLQQPKVATEKKLLQPDTGPKRKQQQPEAAPATNIWVYKS